MMKGWCVQVPVVEFGQETLKKRRTRNPSEVEAESGEFDAVYLEMLPGRLERLEVQFPQPALVPAQFFHFWLSKSKRKRDCKQILNIQFENPMTHRIFSSRISTSLLSIKLSTRADSSVTIVHNF
jgi:hypothetical protein